MRHQIGIYAIEHLESGRFYIGSSSSFSRRKKEHLRLLRRNIHTSRILQNAWNKYGEETFEFYLLEECAESELLTREQAYLDTFRPVLNICWTAGRVTSPDVDARRAATLRAKAALITHCPKGHAYDDANTYRNQKGKRICRRCNADRVAGIFKNDTLEQRAQRLSAMRANHERNREQRLLAMRKYAADHREEKRAYDRARRLAHAQSVPVDRDGPTSP